MLNLIMPSSWSKIPQGGYYKMAIEDAMHAYWEKIIGKYLIKVGSLSCEIDSENCPIKYHLNLSPYGNLDSSHLDARVDPKHLPIRNNTINACILANTLCYFQNYMDILLEASRVLNEDGWLIISFFSGNLTSVVNIPAYGINICSIYLKQLLITLNYEIVHHDNLKSEFSTIESTKKSLELILARKKTLSMPPKKLYKTQACLTSYLSLLK